MNNGMRTLLAGLLLCAAVPALAQDAGDDKKADKAAVELEKEAGKPDGTAAVTERLKAEFKVDDARLQGLMGQKLGYGEIAIVLSLAQAMPGGIDDANVQKVTALRQGPPVKGWGKVAKELGLNLGQAISKVKKLSAEARKAAAKSKAAGKTEKTGKAEKAGKPEKAERQEKAGKPERTEHGRK